jgi:uncharacterized membrane protein
MPATPRFDAIDALRGVAIVWMTVFHFCFDLNHFGWLREDFYRDPVWTWQRTAIVSLFLFCARLGPGGGPPAGAGLAALLAPLGPGGGLCAAGHGRLVPDVPEELHLLWRAARHCGHAHPGAADGRLGALAVVAGRLAIAMKFIAAYAVSTWAAADFLNHPGFNWLGLVSRKPITEDWVPLVPWLGVMWWGMAAGQWLLAQRPAWVQAALPGAAAPLSWLGRWSLSWYMLHQPVLIGALMAVKSLTP